MIARGVVISVRPGAITAAMPPLTIGTRVRVGTGTGYVVETGTMEARIALSSATHDVKAGDIVEEDLRGDRFVAGTALLGRAVDSCMEPIDGRRAPEGRSVRSALVSATPFERRPVSTPFPTGVRAIDALATIGRGARVGIFGAPGTGKSTLLETFVAGSGADAVVLALIGERGREAERWLAQIDARTTIVCETSDRDASSRVRAAFVALDHAETLARAGLHVLLVLDSLARVAYALREQPQQADETAGRGGYPPRVFAHLARLVERAGAFERGSITLLATVLSDGDERDPVSEAARSLLDGHIQLSTRLAEAGRFPAIDLLASLSRTMSAVASPPHRAAAVAVRGALARLEATRELRSLGIDPIDPAVCRAIDAEPRLERFLAQGPAPVPMAQTLAELLKMADDLEESHEYCL